MNLSDFPVAYMQAVRLFTFSCRSGGYQPTRYHRDLPGSVHEVYRHMLRVSDSVGPDGHLPLPHPTVLPSVNRETVGTPMAQLSKLNTWPMPTPVNACPSWSPNRAMTRGQGGWPTLPRMTFSVTPPCRIDPAHPPTLHKYLVQKRYARSISGHQETIEHFQDLHPMFNTLSPLKMLTRPLLTQSIPY